MQVTVKFVNPPRDGRKWASIKTGDDKLISYDPAQFQFAKGGSYDIETTSREYEGKTYYTVSAVKQAPAANGNAAGGDRWWMPFVSNTVAHAIAAGKIADPLEIKVWAAAARSAALEIERLVDDYPPD